MGKQGLPDCESFRSCSRDTAIAEAREHLLGFDPSIEELSTCELTAYAARGAVAGWHLRLSSHPDPVRSITLLVDRHFPRSFPSVVLKDRPPYGVWPHIERDGKLCLWADRILPENDIPTQIIDDTILRVWELLGQCEIGANEQDLRNEFLSYWSHFLPNEYRQVKSIAIADAPTRRVFAAFGPKDGMIVVADTEVDLETWIRNANPHTRHPHQSIPAVFVWLPQPMSPAEYPSSTNDLISYVSTHSLDALPLVQAAVDDDPMAICVIMGSHAKDGACLAALVLRRRRGDARNVVTRGYRKNAVPKAVARQRWFGGSTLDRGSVERCDAPWVHGRGKDPGFPRIRDATVAIIGCGSVGGRIALDLATAGVGTIILIDPQTLAAANAGRHVLGISSVGLRKTDALATLIRQNMPHVKSVRPLSQSWEAAHGRNPRLLDSCDLIVAAIGDWIPEAALNDWHLDSGRIRPVMYAWTEAHAAAGHAVLVGSSGGCLTCGFDHGGHPLLALTSWPVGTAVIAEPACGASFSPYGPTELAHVTALASELAIEALVSDGTTSRHRVWAARAARLDQMGGKWTEQWLGDDLGRARGGLVEDLAWPNGPCAACRGVR